MARQLSSFARVVASSLHSRVLEIQVASSNWVTFEQNLLKEYSFNDSSRMTKKDLMDWVESSNQKLSANATLYEFEQRFDRISTLDQTILDSSNVILFLKAVDMKDQGSKRPWTAFGK